MDGMAQMSRDLSWVLVPGPRKGTIFAGHAAAPIECGGGAGRASVQIDIACPCGTWILHPCVVPECLGTCGVIAWQRSLAATQCGVGTS